MKIFNIIPYWINIKTGETIEIKNWVYLKVGESYQVVYEWALKNKERLIADYSIASSNLNNDTSDLTLDVVVVEAKDLMLIDTDDNKYRVCLELVSKIEIQYIEVPIDKEDKVKEDEVRDNIQIENNINNQISD